MTRARSTRPRTGPNEAERPDLHRPFKVPGSPRLPGLASAVAIYLMLTRPVETWTRFVGWMALGIIIYVVYGYRRSRWRSRRTRTRTRPTR